MIKIVFILWLGLFSATLAQACTVVDDAGNKLTLTQPAHRIISLAPDLTETLFVLGAHNNIVGVMQGSNYPIAAKKIPIVASYNSVDVEKVIRLHPDLVVVWGEGQLQQSIKKLGIPIYVSHPTKLTDIASTLTRLGCLTGTEKNAKEAVQVFNQHYHQLEKTYSKKKKLSIFYQVWPQPLMTVSQSSWINDVIELCGGKNIFANLIGAAPEVDLEAVILANPQVIIGTREKSDWRSFWQKWSHLTAVKKNNLVVIDPDLIERASPRLLEGAKEMCEAIDTARQKT